MVGFRHLRPYVIDERPFEGAKENLVLVGDERLYAFPFQKTDYAGAHVHHLLVVVGDGLVDNPLKDTRFYSLVEESQQQGGRLLERQDFQFVSILDVHDLVADVIGSLHQIDQWVAHMAQWLVLAREPDDAQVVGNAPVGFLLAAEESELAFLSRHQRREGVLHDGSQCGIGKYEPSLATALETVGEQAESIGIALEVGDVAPEHLAHLTLEFTPRSLGEEGLDGTLARMAKWWVAHVVGQASR